MSFGRGDGRVSFKECGDTEPAARRRRRNRRSARERHIDTPAMLGITGGDAGWDGG